MFERMLIPHPISSSHVGASMGFPVEACTWLHFGDILNELITASHSLKTHSGSISLVRFQKRKALLIETPMH